MLHDIYHRARSSDPATAFAALCRLGWAYPVLPSSDSGFKSYGLGRLCLPTETNRFTNPNFAIDTNSDGMADGISGTIGTVANDAYTLPGGGIQRFVASYTAGDDHDWLFALSDYMGVDAFAAADPALFQSLVTALAKSGCTVKPTIYAYTAASGYNGNFEGAAITAAGTHAVTYASLPANTTKVRIGFNLNDWVAGSSLDISFAKWGLAKSSILTSHFTGDTPGCYWSGAANASESVRAGSGLAYAAGIPTNLHLTGTVAVRVMPLAGGADTSTMVVAFPCDGTTSNYYALAKAGAAWRSAVGAASGETPADSPALSFSAGTVHTLVGRWLNGGGGSVDLNYDGTDRAQVANTRAPSAFNALWLGRLPAGTNPAYAYIGPVLISPVRASDAFTATLQGTGGALYSDVMGMVELSRRHNLQPFMIAPLISDSVAYTVTQ